MFEYLDRRQRKPNLTQMFRLAAAQSLKKKKKGNPAYKHHFEITYEEKPSVI